MTSSKTHALAIAAPILGLILLFQNCAPAPLQSRELSSAEAGDMVTNVPMSKVIVHLENSNGVVFSDVQLVADDVATTIDEVADPVTDDEEDAVIVNATKSSAQPLVMENGESPSSFNLELPLGAQKIIVARAKVRDPISNVVSSYYGNIVVTLNEARGDVTIQMVAIP